MAVMPPCKGCQDRTTGEHAHACHNTCEKYQAFRAAQIKETEARDKYWKVHGIIQAGKRRRQEVPPWEIYGTLKERRRENGQKWPSGRV